MTFLKSNLAISVFKMCICFHLIISCLGNHTEKFSHMFAKRKKITRTFFAALFVKVEGREGGRKGGEGERERGREGIHVQQFYLSSSETEDLK